MQRESQGWEAWEQLDSSEKKQETKRRKNEERKRRSSVTMFRVRTFLF